MIMGAVDAAEASRWAARADVCVMTERPIYERCLGSSARAAGWMERGVPFICTSLSELGSVIESEELGLTYTPGDSDGLARAILDAASDPARLRDVADRAQTFARTHWGRSSTTAPLSQWVRSAGRSPDAAVDNPIAISALLEEKSELIDNIHSLRVELGDSDRRYHEARAALGEIHHSRMWKFWMAYLACARLPRRLVRGLRSRSHTGRQDAGDGR
jgi:hypothetical protein